MSRQAVQDDRWLGGYRRIAVVILLMIIVATLARTYQHNREEAQQLTLTLLGVQFAERAQRLHGLWLDERRPQILHVAGKGWQFDARGWPLGLVPLQSPSENCRQLWLALVGETDDSLPPLQFLALPDGSGCEMGWDGYRLVYQFSDGRVMKKPLMKLII